MGKTMDRDIFILSVLMIVGFVMIGYYYLKASNYTLTITQNQPTSNNQITNIENNTPNTPINNTQQENEIVNNTSNSTNENSIQVVKTTNNYVLMKLSGNSQNIKLYTFSTTLYNYVIIETQEKLSISSTKGLKFVIGKNRVMIRYSKTIRNDDITFDVGQSEYLLRIKNMAFEQLKITFGNYTYNDNLKILFIPVSITPEVPPGVIIIKTQPIIPKSTNIDVAISGSNGQILIYKPIVPFDTVQFKVEAKILTDKIMTKIVTIPKSEFETNKQTENQTTKTKTVIISPLVVVMKDTYKYIFTYNNTKYTYESKIDINEVTINQTTFEFANKKYVDVTPFITTNVNGNKVSIQPVGFTTTVTYYDMNGNIISQENMTLGDAILLLQSGKLIKTSNVTKTIQELLSGVTLEYDTTLSPSSYLVVLTNKFAYVNISNIPDGIIATLIVTDGVHKRINAHKIVLPVGVNNVNIIIYAKFDGTIYTINIPETVIVPPEFGIISEYGVVTINGVIHDIVTGVTDKLSVKSYVINNGGTISKYGGLSLYFVDVTSKPITEPEIESAIKKGQKFDISIDMTINNNMDIKISTNTPIKVIIIGTSNIQTEANIEIGKDYAIIMTNNTVSITIPQEDITKITDIYIIRASNYEPIIDSMVLPNNLIYYHLVFSS